MSHSPNVCTKCGSLVEAEPAAYLRNWLDSSICRLCPECGNVDRTNEMGHSKEPWIIGQKGFPDPRFIWVGSTVKDYDFLLNGIAAFPLQYPNAVADAERTAACVNFCRGIPNEILIRRNDDGAHVSNTQVRIALRELGEQPA